MTSNKIQETTDGLRRVNGLLGKYVREQALSYEEKRELWLFYKEHKDTNTLIDCVVAMAEEDMDLLLSDARQLLKEAEALIGIYSSSEPLFLLSLRMFIQERARAYDTHDEELRRRKEAEHKVRCISFEEYCKRKRIRPCSLQIGRTALIL